ncbi:DUF4276 family protein [Desulfococcaceae bacterium HSG8]|nr:DUF4276 family protein [Desulfococcaceae bacterium HSG8]
MNNFAEIVAIAEGKTEQIFIQEIVSPYLAGKGIYITPIIISKPGQKGGDVKFARVRNDIELHLKQRADTFLTLFIDYYGIRSDWPGFTEAKKQSVPDAKAEKINTATKDQVNKLFGDHGSERRFIPYVAMHEFEAMLFSDPEKLADQLQVPLSAIDRILTECGEPEKINDSPHSAPSKRLKKLSSRFRKTSKGIAIAKATGLVKIRENCPIFNKWLTEIECLK